MRAAPDDPEANYGLGRLLFARGENEAALAALRTAHLAAPANLARRTAYAAALTRGGHPGNAVALLTAVGELPEDYAAALELGRALRLADRAAEAETPLRRAAGLRPQEADPLLELARLLAADRPKEAARCYENAKKYGATPDPELEKSLGPLVNQRAELADFLAGAAAEAEKNGDNAAAGWYYAELVKADPENPVHRWKAIQYLLLQNRMEEADLMIGDAADPADRLLRAAWFLLRKKPAEAVKALEGAPEKVAMPLLPALARKLGENDAAQTIRARVAP